MNRADSPFYLGINHTKDPLSKKTWFKSSAMGVNKLNSLMKTMAQKAGLESQRLKNHSARKGLVQKLNDSDVPPTHIMQVSGHKNVQSINNYSHVSVQQQKNMSRILSSSSTESAEPANVPALPVARSNSEETTEMVSSSSSKGSGLPVGLFSGAVIHGGHFNITVNTLNQSPKSSTTKRFKRVRRIFDSSDEDSPPLV